MWNERNDNMEIYFQAEVPNDLKPNSRGNNFEIKNLKWFHSGTVQLK